MNNNISKSVFSIFLTIFISSFLSCKTWSQKDWENLKDRNFTLSKIEINSKEINKKISFSYMKRIPVFKILHILSHKYNIEIDSSHYEDFLISGDFEDIKSSGILSDTTFVWQHPDKLTNEVIIEYTVDKQEVSKGDLKSYKISLKSRDATRAYFFGGIANIEEILASAAGKLGYERVPGKGANVFVNEDTGKEITLTAKKLTKIKKEKKIQMNQSELLIVNMVDNYIKLLPPEEKKAFKKKLIRYLKKK
jgi:hypothetical protein